jgi:hypothetical protein
MVQFSHLVVTIISIITNISIVSESGQDTRQVGSYNHHSKYSLVDVDGLFDLSVINHQWLAQVALVFHHPLLASERKDRVLGL